MGICGSKKSPEDRRAESKSRKIDQEIEDDIDKDQMKIKLLLLGAGESGKSTVIKQMRVLYGAEYTDEERVQFRLYIHQNIIETMEQVLSKISNLFNLNLINDKTTILALSRHPGDDSRR